MSNRNTSAGRPCAECRRLKHKCDRQLPCSNCVKKGCGDLCPEGTNATGEGHRRFWSRTHELQDTLRDLAARIAALEAALRTSHAIHATKPHPLLAEDLLRIKEPHLRAPSSTAPASQPFVATRSSSSQDGTSTLSVPDFPSIAKADDTSSGMVEALGSLALNRNGRTKYFGPAALAACFLSNEQPVRPAVKHEDVLDFLPPDICMIASAFPLSLLHDHEDGRSQRLATLRCFLPSPEEARRYKALYYTYGTFTTSPVPEHEFDEIIYPIIYDQQGGEDDQRAHHCLSVVFLICAIGAMVDPLLPSRNGDGAKYYELGCAALFGSRVIEDPTIEAVQALCLVATYITFSRTLVGSNTYRIEWAIVGLATRIAQTMGLRTRGSFLLEMAYLTYNADRDPGSFHLPPKQVQRRRRLWWNLYGHDSWNSIGFSLPPGLSSKHFDTKWPEISDEVGANLTSAWRWSYCVECLEPMQQEMTAVARPSYDTIMELDHKLRTHPIPQMLLYRPITTQDLSPAQLSTTFQRSLSSMTRDSALVVLHRNYCDRATDERPDDPLNHLYGTSVITVYRSAWAVLAIAGATYEHMAHPTTRITCVINMAFTSVAALCLIITRCPRLTLVPDALLQLDRFYEIVLHYLPTDKTFQTISELRQAAHAAYTDHFLRTDSVSASGGTRSWRPTDVIERREAMLARLGGKTRLIDYSSLRMPDDGLLSDDGMTQMGMGVVPVPLHLPVEMHPHVMEYLQGMVMPENAVF